MILLLVVGNPLDIKCWSGTPYYIREALISRGENVQAPDTSYGKLNLIRLLWLMGRVIIGKPPRGFQYSNTYERFFIKPHLKNLQPQDVVLSLNTHLPSKHSIESMGLNVIHYDDSTVAQIVNDPNYYWSSITPTDKWVFEKEGDAICASKLAIGMTKFAQDGFQHYLDASNRRANYVLGGVNLPNGLLKQLEGQTNTPRASREIHFGLVAVDPEFKGYDLLKEVMLEIEKRGVKCFAHVIGGIPKNPSANTVCYGFINKNDAPNRFVEIIRKMDYGWLHPKFEAFGITVLEFYSYQIPMITLKKFGPSSTASNELGLAIEELETGEQIAQRILNHWNGTEHEKSKRRLDRIKNKLTWNRALEEIFALYENASSFTPYRLPK